MIEAWVSDEERRDDIDIGSRESCHATRRWGAVLGAVVVLLSATMAAGQTFSFEGLQHPTSVWDEVAPEVVVLIDEVPAGLTVHVVFLHGASVLYELDMGPDSEVTDVRLAFAALQVVTIRCDRAPWVGFVATGSTSDGGFSGVRTQSGGSCLEVDQLGPLGLEQMPVTWGIRGQHMLVADRWMPVMVLVARRADGSAALPSDLVAAYVAVTADGERPGLPQPVSSEELSELRNAALGW